MQSTHDLQGTEPRMVKLHDIRIDADYASWIAEIKYRYRSAQVKAAVKVNAEKLLFNWQLGRDLVQKKVEERWGAGVVEQVSLDLKHEFPDANGFSTSNLWYMKKWYQFYTDSSMPQKLQRLVGEIKDAKLCQVGAEIADIKLQQPIGEFPLPFALVPWGTILRLSPSVNAVDELLKADDDNDTIGLLICSDMNKTEVQWSFRGIATPMGVATYDNIRVKEALPSQELLAERMELLQKELRETKRLMSRQEKEDK